MKPHHPSLSTRYIHIKLQKVTLQTLVDRIGKKIDCTYIVTRIKGGKKSTKARNILSIGHLHC